MPLLSVTIIQSLHLMVFADNVYILNFQMLKRSTACYEKPNVIQDKYLQVKLKRIVLTVNLSPERKTTMSIVHLIHV